MVGPGKKVKLVGFVDKSSPVGKEEVHIPGIKFLVVGVNKKNDATNQTRDKMEQVKNAVMENVRSELEQRANELLTHAEALAR